MPNITSLNNQPNNKRSSEISLKNDTTRFDNADLLAKSWGMRKEGDYYVVIKEGEFLFNTILPSE